MTALKLIPYPQIDKSLDADTRLKAAEPMFCAGLHPECGQLEGGTGRGVIRQFRRQETPRRRHELRQSRQITIIAVAPVDEYSHGKTGIEGYMRTVQVGEP